MFFLFVSTAHAQTIERKIINTAGTSYNTTGVRLKVSVGEPIIGNFTKATSSDTVSILSQGFFTGFIRKAIVTPPPPPPTPVDSVDTVVQHIPDGYSIYPNPVKDILFIKGDLVFIRQAEFFDIAGHRLYTQKPGQGGDLPLRNLSSGFYIVKLINTSGEIVNVFKIIKL